MNKPDCIICQHPENKLFATIKDRGGWRWVNEDKNFNRGWKQAHESLHRTLIAELMCLEHFTLFNKKIDEPKTSDN